MYLLRNNKYIPKMSVRVSVGATTLYKYYNYLPKIVRGLYYPFNTDHATQQAK